MIIKLNDKEKKILDIINFLNSKESEKILINFFAKKGKMVLLKKLDEVINNLNGKERIDKK